MIRTHPKEGDRRFVRRFLWQPKTLRVCVSMEPVLREVRDDGCEHGYALKLVSVDEPVYARQTRWLVWASWEQVYFSYGIRGHKWADSPHWQDAHALKWREDEGDY